MKYKMIRRSFLKRPCLKCSINHWFKWKDYLNIYEAGHTKHNRRQHVRHVKSRDYGRLFHSTKFNYDPYQEREEKMDYFEERARLREIEGYQE